MPSEAKRGLCGGKRHLCPQPCDKAACFYCQAPWRGDGQRPPAGCYLRELLALAFIPLVSPGNCWPT